MTVLCDAAGTPVETKTETGAETPAPRSLGDQETEPAFVLVRPVFQSAEDRGFEPLRALTQPAFQASAIGH